MTIDGIISSFAYCFLRALARFWGSVFFPLYKIWGETSASQKKRVFIARYRGFLTWLTILRVFKKKIRFILILSKCDIWVKIAKICGIDLVVYKAHTPFSLLFADDYPDTMILFDEPMLELAHESVNSVSSIQKKLLFFAISGIHKVFPPDCFVPRVELITALCAMPFWQDKQKMFAELLFLESALENITSSEQLPSLFLHNEQPKTEGAPEQSN